MKTRITLDQIDSFSQELDALVDTTFSSESEFVSYIDSNTFKNTILARLQTFTDENAEWPKEFKEVELSHPFSDSTHGKLQELLEKTRNAQETSDENIETFEVLTRLYGLLQKMQDEYRKTRQYQSYVDQKIELALAGLAEAEAILEERKTDLERKKDAKSQFKLFEKKGAVEDVLRSIRSTKADLNRIQGQQSKMITTDSMLENEKQSFDTELTRLGQGVIDIIEREQANPDVTKFVGWGILDKIITTIAKLFHVKSHTEKSLDETTRIITPKFKS